MLLHSSNMSTAKSAVSQAAMHAESEDWLRSRVHALLARLFADIPSADLIATLSALDITEHEGPLAPAWQNLAHAAAKSDPESLDIEYHNLFIGLGRGEVLPFGSWYQTGFLMGRPLAQLREDLRVFGLERESDVHEPEDHVGALLDCMALLSGPDGASLASQRAFFNAHLATWIERFMQDVQRAESADFYVAVGAFAERFMVTEKQYLEMV